MKRARSIVPIIWVFLLCVGVFAQQGQVAEETVDAGDLAQFDGATIAAVEIRGAEHIPASELIGVLKYTKVGSPFNSQRTSEDVDAVKLFFYDKGYMNSRVDRPRVEETLGGVDVIISVKEGRFDHLGKLTVEGNKSISSDEITAKLGVKVGDVIGDRQIFRWKDEIEQLYGQRLGFRVSTSIIRHDLPDSEEGTVDVVLTINEGQRVDPLPVVEIAFRGNEKIPTAKLLAGLEYFRVGDRFHIEKLRTDMDRLRILVYADQGYLKAQFDDPQIEPMAGGLKVTLSVKEGAQYLLGKVTVKGNTLLSTDQVRGILNLSPGEVIVGPKINKGMDELKRAYGEYGFIEFNPDLAIDWHDSPDSSQGVADLTFNMEEGKQYSIRSIAFRGNTATTERELMRILGLETGATFNQKQLDAGIARLNHLGLFEPAKIEDVTVNTNQEAGQVDLDFNLKERH